MRSCSQLSALAGLVVVAGFAAPALAQPANGGLTASRPLVWEITGQDASSYALSDVSTDGRSSSLRRVTQGSGFGATAAGVDAAPYRGRRVRLSAELRAENATSGASTWLRIDGANFRQIALDNNMQRALHGTVDWTKQVTELDVPEDAQRIWVGLILVGEGTVRARDVRVDPVDRAVTPLAWRTDNVGGSSPFYEVVDTSAQGRDLTLRRMEGGSMMDNEFGTATTKAPAPALGGRRVTVRAMVRTRDAAAASIWVRADGGGRTLALENNMARAVSGTTDWTERTAVVDFPAGTEMIAYGLLLVGRGSISVRDISVSSAPITGEPLPGLPMRP